MRRSISLLTIVFFVGSVYISCESPALKGAKVYLGLNETAKAKEQLIIVTTNDPANFDGQYLLGELYYKESNFVKMNEHFDACLVASQKYKGAIEEYRLLAFTRVYGEGSRFLNAGGDEEDADKQKLAFELAIAEMEKAYAIMPDSRALESQAIGYFALGNDAEAERLYKEVVEVDPENTTVLLRLGNMKFNKAETMRVDEGAGKDQVDPLYIEALGYFQQYSETNPDQTDAVIGSIAWCHVQLGDVEKAINVYKSILDDEPDNVDIVIQLGDLKYKIGDRENALKDFDAALASRPDDYSLLKYVSQTLWNNLIPKINSETEKLTKEEITVALPYIEKLIALHEENNDKELSIDDEYFFTQALFRLLDNLYKIEPTPELEKKKDDAFTKFTAAANKKG